MDVSAAAAVAAALAAFLALYFSGVSARAAKASAKSTERAAASASESAKHAAAVAQVEQERRDEERERRHESLSPHHLAPLDFKLEIGVFFKEDGLLFGSFYSPRSYRVRAIMHDHEGQTKSADVGLVRAHHRSNSFVVERWPPINGADCPRTTMIRLQFWPPRADDDAEAWTCPCGRPTDDTSGGPGHWEVCINVPAVPVTAKKDLDWVYRDGEYGRAPAD
ncbi:hypothetical protein [Planomonospora sp. ID82291]|uniref:hypothetical protein n=1 Tax=Planomonospora sp. ID82291 TaxID=2738136 RepID=UPI0018C41AE0|nr:hypothetical protein [Planomonospora sp. ID82291]MBG0818967.1 hypothetical protein [Planomonospora sp. ID82291]